MTQRNWWQRLRAAFIFLSGLGRNVTALRADVDALQQAVALQQAAALQEQDVRQYKVQELASRLDWLQKNHEANVAWLQQVYPEIAQAIGRKIEEEQLQQHSERLFAALYRELASRPAGSAAAATTAEPAAVTVQGMADPAFYLALEERFRGTRSGVAERQQPYLDYLTDVLTPQHPLLDIGCGRGEWLHLLRARGLPAHGLDLNPANAAACRAVGLDVTTADACAHLAIQEAGSLGAITAFQVVEHLEFPVLMAFLTEARRVLAPGGILILETPNPENLNVATRTFWLDPTHVRPLPSELLEFAASYVGLEPVSILRLNPEAEWNEADTLSRHLHGPRDYALIARCPCDTTFSLAPSAP